MKILKIVGIFIFGILAFAGITQRNVSGGENNIYLGLACLFITLLLIYSLFIQMYKELKQIRCMNNKPKKITDIGEHSMKRKWYLQTWFICLLFAFSFTGITAVIGIILLVMHYLDDKKQATHIKELENSRRNEMELKQKLKDLDAETYFEVKKKIDDGNNEIQDHNEILDRLRTEITNLEYRNNTLEKQLKTNERKLSRTKELYKSIDYCITNFIQTDTIQQLSASDMSEYDEFSPSVILKLHCMDMKDLRKAYRENDKTINQVLETYAARYTTKANRSIYQLMVIALRAELQNILYNLKYQKLDQAISDVKNVTTKYLKIAGEGNQSIAGTLTKFIGEIEYLFISAVKIEYNYYVKKEQAKQEQLALKQQMREEAEERKALETQKKKIEMEESKYQSEINKATEALSVTTDTEQIAILKAKILELQGQLSDVVLKKDEIVKLQNGKAGNVYIISNLGSFGENIFKIGMTRRINPQERVDELGSASVPFRFDVHSFIFSDDAVSLEKKMHEMLNSKRVNKVNMRKEFFYSTLDELEEMVNQLDPAAEFNRTMIAEEYRQSQSTNVPYTTDYVTDSDDSDE